MKNMKRLCMETLALACVLSVAPVQAKGATLVKEGQTVNETVEHVKKAKYKIVLKKDSVVKLKVKDCIVNGELDTGSKIQEGTYAATKGTYNLDVRPMKKSGPISFSYKIDHVIKSSFKNNKNTSLKKAFNISLNKKYSGWLNKLFLTQYYKVNVSSAGTVKVTFPKAKRYQDDMYVFTNDQKKTKDPASVVYGAKTFKVKKGTYYFCMVATSGLYDYTFKLKFTK